ncbi:AAA family ATPase [Natronolimnohabitans innermongolicus]|uniref:ATPase AAA n=1 Tax=Natronolimnohabitans innermongolicus JCM 12255 TaxID=1227499 RepID=L9XCF4_9EURY|nr:AAA family ATPase [Natronolimnohabitans innermongolicus]ELY58303.1 ATPase AAA [Natronolimnohabitans innermongolicus JCM 12255]
MDDDLFDGAPIHVFSIGDDGRWPELVEAGQIRVGYPETDGDLSTISGKRDVEDQFDLGRKPGWPKSKILAKFVTDLSEGDLLIAKQGKSTIRGIGIVRSDYHFEATPTVGDSSDQHYRYVGWLDLTFDGQIDGIETDGVVNFMRGAARKEHTDSYTEIRSLILDETTNAVENYGVHVESALEVIEEEATARSLGFASDDSVEPEPVSAVNIYRNRGNADDFAEKIEQTVGASIDEELAQKLRKVLEEHPATDIETLTMLAGDDVRIFGVSSNNGPEYATLQRGDYVLHQVDSTVRYLQKVTYSLNHLPNHLREELSEVLYDTHEYHGIWIATGDPFTVAEEWSSVEGKFQAELDGSDNENLLLSRMGYFDQFNPHLIESDGGASEILTSLFTEYNDFDIPEPVLMRDYPQSQVADEPWTGPDVETPRDGCFIAIKDAGSYKDSKDIYHFKAGIPGSRQLRNAEENGVVALLQEHDEHGWQVDSIGMVGDIEPVNPPDTESENVDNQHYYLHFEEVYSIPPIRLDDLKPYLSKEVLTGAGIFKVTPQDLDLILSWHSGTLEIALSEVDSARRPDLYKQSLVHLVAGRNLAFYGPPGTGKTFTARELSKMICGEDGVHLETAHSEWTNHEIAGGWQPAGSTDSDKEWIAVPGVLSRAGAAAESSLRDDGQPSWLIIDELNRANLDQAFGEVFTLLDLDYRANREIEYGNDSQQLPLSFRILATMNTHDLAQLFSLGYAFRRRFAFVRVSSLTADTSPSDCSISTPSNTTASDAIDLLNENTTDTADLIVEAAMERLMYDESDSPFNGNVIDPVTIFPQLATPRRVQLAQESLTEREFDLETEYVVETLVAFARYTDERDLLELGHAVLMDALTYVLAHELLFPGETTAETVDEATQAYIVPQFEHVLSELRRAETLGDEDAIVQAYDDVVTVADELGLPGTARALYSAKEAGSILE